MSSRRVRRPVSGAAEDVIAFAASAANSLSRRKMLLIGAVSAVLVILAIPIVYGADTSSAAVNTALQCYDSAGNYVSCRAEVPSVAANNALKCYDSAGKYEPCVSATRASALPSRFIGQTVADHQPTSPTETARYQPASWSASAPVARLGSSPARRPVSSICGRHLIPCFFSTLRKGVTHIASVAAMHGARSARTHNPSDF